MQRKWKRRWQRLAKAVIVPATAGLLLLSAYSTALANPTNGNVTSGSATITATGNTTTINQSSSKAIINWTSFSVAKGETVNFVQPSASAVALNRVTGNSASEIYGSLNANGKVYLVNPNGILFAKGAQVNVGGLVASTLAIKDSDFLSGNYVFSGGDTGSVVNQGTITANNEAVFIGSKVANEGVVAAKVAGLAAGKQVSLDFSGDSLLNVTVDTGVAGGSAVNSGTITANAGLVVMSAGTKDALLSTVVNNRGLIRAQSVKDVNGVIRLEGGTVTNAGTLDASGKAAGQTGGAVKVLGDTVNLETGSTIDVSGDAGGGTALVGGAYQGGSSEYAATTTTVQNGAKIKADAITTGNGGQVVVWANDTTKFAGTITARGGSVSGDGGSVETSGKKILKVADTANVTTLAANGRGGTWLLDPNNFTIAASGGDITGAQVTSALASNGTVTILSSSGGTAGNGNIYVNDAISWSSGALTLTAANNININAALNASGSGSLAMNAATANGSDAAVSGGTISYGLTTSGFTGCVNFSGTGTLTINNQAYTVINSITDLANIASDLSGYYVLGSNLTASGTFTSIGTSTSAFTGTFDGLGHTVSNLTISGSSDYTGLFACSSGTISNLGLVGVNVSGGSYVGTLIGYSSGGATTSCYSTGTVSGTANVGGLIGYVNAGTVSDCHSEAVVTATADTDNNSNAGGLIGKNKGTVTNSYSTGAVTANGSYIGGLIGYNAGAVTDCYATGDVTLTNSGTAGTAYCVGGLIGYNNGGAITDCYTTGDVTAKNYYYEYESYAYAGGLVGYNNGGNITDCYTTGAVTSSAGRGGWRSGGL
ncbi:Heme/hemopexin-binding protein precursor [Sporomusa ovata DSM 2662]|uniref:two-partner secretion domain-containing protein n=1 Tax=Sporomusa ovata TaxID=2378 RepID=UPI0030D4238D